MPDRSTVACGLNRRSGPDRRHQWSHTEDRYHSLQVIGQNVEAHLGSDLVQGPGQEVGGAHPSFEGSERVFDGLSSHAHGVGHAVELVLFCAIPHSCTADWTLTRDRAAPSIIRRSRPLIL